MLEVIVFLIILVNLPSIIGAIIGFTIGLVEVAAEDISGAKAEDTFENRQGRSADKNEYSEVQNNNGSGTQSHGYFAGCTTTEELRTRYRALMKIYHPDGMGGDAGTAQRINIEYEQFQQALDNRKDQRKDQ